MTIEDKFVKEYTPLVKQFIEEVKSLNSEDLPEPHLPFYGAEYEESSYKIAFVGWETRNWKNLKKFISDYKKLGFEPILKWLDYDCGEENGFAFATENKYHNNTGNDFWGFIFKFLSAFYNKNDWREIKDGKKYPEILKSFIWSNIESIERFEVADRGENSSIEDWKKVKKASLIFDNSAHLINTFQPNIIIVLHWPENDTWLTGSLPCSAVKIADHLNYYFIKNTKTHVFWTAHPIWLAIEKRVDEMIKSIIEVIQQKQVFTSFPGEAFLVRKQQIIKLKQQLKEKSIAINLEPSDEDLGLGGELLVYFDIPFSKRNAGFWLGFDSEYKDFSIGVYIKDQSVGYINLKNEISAKLIPIIGKDRKFTNWAYLHYFDDDLENWKTNSKVWDNIENGIIANTLIEICKKIQKSLISVDL